MRALPICEVNRRRTRWQIIADCTQKKIGLLLIV
jgi:hypothetical protein